MAITSRSGTEAGSLTVHLTDEGTEYFPRMIQAGKLKSSNRTQAV